VVATCVAAVPLAAVISACKTILVELIARPHTMIKIGLGDGRKIEVRNIRELEQVLARLDGSEFAKKTERRKSRRNP
jgi:hypothetical protein